MEAWLLYLLKASVILVLFHAVYEVLLKKETFFTLNRIYLLAGLSTAMLHPVLKVKRFVQVGPLADAVTSGFGATSEAAIHAASTSNAIYSLFVGLIIAGTILMGLRLCIQLKSLRDKLVAGSIVKMKGHILVETQADITPFSFFQYIFYNPDKHNSEELGAILQHEKAHCRQWHSLDVMLANLSLLITWANPVSWWYLDNIKQNLEFMADREATRSMDSRKKYQYAMLKVSTSPENPSLSNSFYHSLIKNRIVMLHQSPSKKINRLKTLVVIPLLSLFLYAFNSETVYLPSEGISDTQNWAAQPVQFIKIHIDKDTSNEELEELKKEMKNKGIDFSYTAVRNENKEIVDLSISLSSETDTSQAFIGSSTYHNDGAPIDPVDILFDRENHMFFTSNKGENMAMTQSEKDFSTFIFTDDDVHQRVEIYKEDGKEVIRVNGEEVTREELEKMEKDGEILKKRIQIKTGQKDDKDVDFNIIVEEGDHAVEILHDDHGSFFFADGSLGPDWMILLDGKVVDQDVVRKLEPGQIKSINVIKGEEAARKYGKEVENALEITTFKK